jgi:phosphopantetheinyl transferase (holo-ACP synthase)
LELPVSFLQAEAGLWEAVLAHLVLGRWERERWHGLPAGQRRRDWLLGRIAAKDAVRELLLSHGDGPAYPADVEIASGREGRPTVRLPSGGDGSLEFAVSIAHSEGVAVAVAAQSRGGATIGIDIERRQRARSGLEEAAFDASERAMIAATGATHDWMLRCWCAKEAAVKALGCGLVHGAATLRVTAIDAQTGAVELAPEPRLRERVPTLADLPLSAHTTVESELCTAVAGWAGARAVSGYLQAPVSG